MSDTAVSVIIPVYNGETYLAEALESVLRQSRRATDVLVVDDGSVDGTGAIARSYGSHGVRYCRQEHAGYVAALNMGLRSTHGENVAFIDCDDVWTDKKLELQMSHLESGSAEIVVGHQQRIWRRPGWDEWSYKAPELALTLGAVIVRRPVFGKIGVFDAAMSHGADWDWFFRAREQGIRFLIHPETVMFYRRHEANMTLDAEAGNKATVNLIKKSLDRRRALAGQAESLPALTLPRVNA